MFSLSNSLISPLYALPYRPLSRYRAAVLAVPGSRGKQRQPWLGSVSARKFDMIEMEQLIAKSLRDFKEGSIVKGRVLELRNREVLVDIGYKSEGVIPLSEFDDPDEIQVGDEIEVLLERLENDEGMVVLSKEKAAHKQNWDKIVKVFQGDGLIKGRVKAVVKGGLTVNIGVEAFLPGSQIDVVPRRTCNNLSATSTISKS